MPHRLTDEQYELCETIPALYQAGFTTPELAKIIGIDPDTVLTRLKRKAITRRKGGTKYLFDYECFAEPLNEKKAYWLGFLFADGCIFNRKRIRHPKWSNWGLILTLGRKDIKHLEKFKKFLRATHPILHLKRPADSITVYLPNTTRKCLLRLGLVPKKTFILRTPLGIPAELMRHFYRGYLDGDGSISKDRRRKTSWEIGISGTEAFLTNMGKYFELHPFSVTPYSHKPKTYRLRYCGSRALAITSLLYKDATIYLDRKYALYQQMMKEVQH